MAAAAHGHARGRPFAVPQHACAPGAGSGLGVRRLDAHAGRSTTRLLTTERTPSTIMATSIMRSWSDFSSTLPDRVTTPFCAITCRSRALTPCSLTSAWRTFSLSAASTAGESAFASADCAGCGGFAAEGSGRGLVASFDGRNATPSRAGSLLSTVLDGRSQAARLSASATGNARAIAFTAFTRASLLGRGRRAARGIARLARVLVWIRCGLIAGALRGLVGRTGAITGRKAHGKQRGQCYEGGS